MTHTVDMNRENDLVRLVWTKQLFWPPNFWQYDTTTECLSVSVLGLAHKCQQPNGVMTSLHPSVYNQPVAADGTADRQTWQRKPTDKDTGSQRQQQIRQATEALAFIYKKASALGDSAYWPVTMQYNNGAGFPFFVLYKQQFAKLESPHLRSNSPLLTDSVA